MPVLRSPVQPEPGEVGLKSESVSGDSLILGFRPRILVELFGSFPSACILAGFPPGPRRFTKLSVPAPGRNTWEITSSNSFLIATVAAGLVPAYLVTIEPNHPE